IRTGEHRFSVGPEPIGLASNGTAGRDCLSGARHARPLTPLRSGTRPLDLLPAACNGRTLGSIAREATGEIRTVLRDLRAASVDARAGTHGLRKMPGAGEARRRAGLRAGLGRGASLPRG